MLSGTERRKVTHDTVLLYFTDYKKGQMSTGKETSVLSSAREWCAIIIGKEKIYWKKTPWLLNFELFTNSLIKKKFYTSYVKMPKWLFIRVSWKDTGKNKIFHMVTVHSSKDMIKSKSGSLKFVNFWRTHQCEWPWRAVALTLSAGVWLGLN